MVKERSAFSNDLSKSIILGPFRKIMFKVDTCLSLQVFNLDMVRNKRRRFNVILQKNETNLKR